MSKLFYDKFISFKKIKKRLSKLTLSEDEKYEFWHLIDEIVHHRVLKCILDELDEKHHEEFLVKLHSAPHDEELLDYLGEKIQKDIGEFIRKEIDSIHHEILIDLKGVSKRKRK